MDAQGNQLPLRNLAVDQKESPPHATENIELSFNINSELDSSKLAAVYDKNNANSFSYTTTVQTFDSLGNAQTIKFNYAEQRPVREVYQFTTGQAATNSPAQSIRISNILVDTWVGPDASGAYVPDPAILTEIEAQDKRIDVSTISWTNNTISFEFKSESSVSGDIIVTENGSALEVANLQDGEPATRTANEVQAFVIHDDSATTAAKFDANGKLVADTNLVIGGVTIPLDTAMDADDVGEAITSAQQKIIELNPDIEAIQYNSSTDTVYITWKAEAGDVDPIAITDDDLILSGSPNSPDPVSQNGDNTFMSVYRMYAYLNDSEQLNVGKRVDPGESGFDNKDTEVGPIIIKFDTTTGVLSEVNGDAIIAGGAVPKITILGADPANPNDTLLDSDTDNLVGLQLDISGSSQFASDSIVKAATQDGYTKGDLIGVTFQDTGEMVASFSNGQRQNLGLVALATFENQSGLQPSGSTEWLATLTSGQAILNPPGTGLNGTIQSAALEQSNVDISEELVALIEAQRNFQANSKTLETLNTVTQSILQI